jgi:hypothetical protein
MIVSKCPRGNLHVLLMNASEWYAKPSINCSNKEGTNHQSIAPKKRIVFESFREIDFFEEKNSAKFSQVMFTRQARRFGIYGEDKISHMWRNCLGAQHGKCLSLSKVEELLGGEAR